MNKSIKDEIIDAIKNERIEKKDEGSFPSAHSEPFFYKTLNGDHFVLLRARKDSKYATQADIIESYRKQQSLYPFLSKQNLPVHTAHELEIIKYDNEVYAVMKRFFGYGHNHERFAKATSEQQKRIVKQIADFFFKLHSIPMEVLPTGIDYTPYFKYDKDASKDIAVFLHADFNYSNFLVDNDYNLHAVFDWHPACIGPRIAEFAAFVYCNDLDFLPLVLNEYNKLASTSIFPEEVIRHNAARW